jgi:hypothetical protein
MIVKQALQELNGEGRVTRKTQLVMENEARLGEDY